MQGKKSLIVDSVVMFPNNKGQYSPKNLNSCESFKLYPYLKDYVDERSSQEQKVSGSDVLSYDKLAIEKGFVAFSGDIRDAMFYLPKGVLVYDAVHAYAERIMREEGFIKLEIPYFFSKSHDDSQNLTDKFGDRVMGISADGDTFLKYASDPVLFAYLRDKEIPFALDPLKIYSPGDTFRNEQSGEVHRFERPRMSFIEDYHIFTSDWKDVVRDAHKMNTKVMNTLCNQWLIGCDTEESFFKKNQDYWQEMVQLGGKPILFNLMSSVPNYFNFEFKYSYGTSNGNFIYMANLQIDETNGPRFNIKMGDKDPATIIHGNTTGRMQKVFIPLFDQAIKMQKQGEKPSLPLWLSPTQVRIIPVNNSFVEYCANLSEQYKEQGIRVDIDDRDLGLNKKIKTAEQEWIPYVVIIGQNEIQNDNISLRVRNESEQKISTNQSLEDLEAKLSGFPKVPTNIPLFVSKQTDFSFR